MLEQPFHDPSFALEDGLEKRRPALGSRNVCVDHAGRGPGEKRIDTIEELIFARIVERRHPSCVDHFEMCVVNFQALEQQQSPIRQLIVHFRTLDAQNEPRLFERTVLLFHGDDH